MNSEPDPEPAIACALDPTDLDVRLAEWRTVAASATSHVPIEGGLRLALPGIDPRPLVDLVARERECCAFLSFAIRLDPTGLTLEVTGPPDAREMIEALADPAMTIR